MTKEELFDKLSGLGFTEVVIHYSGEEDEGYVSEIEATPDNLPEIAYALEQDVEDFAYRLLEGAHPGWEINEGSQGHITLNVETRQVFMHHGENEVTTHYQDTVI